ncbi:hypothetical protein BDY17DRAFT_116001 [Neohortaea acidophila]|uniref:Methyltransferase type 11 domain-containing protein n=1 Tax=Neohortaea acidophila TaxID=245834 RepID=A0A6A6PUN6_9PEZI|nr:uncharacterized protein BDY17DRAFT_116001 [Neohortaea acidophila]KAF2483810.1 hypothetical protein BDY17DRAFT_116001 [Neohortaea acidophila]
MSPAATDHPALPKLGIPNGKPVDMDSKLASPTDSENAEKEMNALDTRMNGTTLEIKTGEASKDPLMHDAVNSAGPTFNDDPLSATALISPLHTVNWETASYFTPRRATVNTIDGALGSPSGRAPVNKWEAFKRTGPHYPPSLEKMVMDYHHRHSKSWQLAHDMGAGSGLYSPILAKYFRHVHISDPSSTGLSKSRTAMTLWSGENKRSRGRFTFSNGKPEQGHEASADRTVDLAIMVEGAHFTNADTMVRSAAQSLSSSGTLALVSYHPVCRITGNPRANEALQRLFAAWGSQPWDVVCGDARGQKQFSQGLDFVPLPAELFDISKTRRITINTQNKGSAAFQVPGAPIVDVSDSRVHPSERRQDFSSENADDQAKGWRQEVGPEFFRSMTAALIGPMGVQRYEEDFKKIGDIIHETSPNGILVTVEWTVAIVLATRR